MNLVSRQDSDHIMGVADHNTSTLNVQRISNCWQPAQMIPARSFRSFLQSALPADLQLIVPQDYHSLPYAGLHGKEAKRTAHKK